ncbi:MAG: hypothetical protein Q4C49_00035 [Bacillota bacterium]|nr:hypothetical protein [Bacillota bacterium]
MVKIEGVEMLNIVELSNKQIDAINGAEIGLLNKEGWDVIVLPYGEDEHRWSSETSGKAFRAFAYRGEDLVFGWVSPATLAGGTLYAAKPTDGQWAQSADKLWWTVQSTAEKVPFGVSTTSKNLINIASGETTIPCLHISIAKVESGWNGRLLPRTAEALAKLRGTRKPSMCNNRPGKDVSMFDVKKYWLGETRLATADDFKKAGVEIPVALKATLK